MINKLKKRYKQRDYAIIDKVSLFQSFLLEIQSKFLIYFLNLFFILLFSSELIFTRKNLLQNLEEIL